MWLPHLYDDKMVKDDPENSHMQNTCLCLIQLMVALKITNVNIY